MVHHVRTWTEEVCWISQKSSDGAATSCCCSVRSSLVCESVQHDGLHRQDQGEPSWKPEETLTKRWMSYCEDNLCMFLGAKYFNIKANFFLEGIRENKPMMENMILQKLFNKM